MDYDVPNNGSKRKNGSRDLLSRLRSTALGPSVQNATITIAVYSTLIMRTRPGELGAIVWGNTHVEIGVLGSIFTATNGNGSAGLLMRSNWVCLFCLDGEVAEHWFDGPISMHS